MDIIEHQGTNSIVEIGDPLEMAAVYTLALLGNFRNS